MTTYTSIDAQILRLRVLAVDAQQITAVRSVTPRKAEDRIEVLVKPHRIHLAVAKQKAGLEIRHKLAGGPAKPEGDRQ